MRALPRRRHSSRRDAGIIIPGLLAIALLSGCKAAQSAATSAAIPAAQAVGSHVGDGTYVALGDSYTAAPLLTGQGSSPTGCLRSAQDYPALVARTLHLRSFTMLATAAARAGVGYVDTYNGTIGHDACQASSVKWVEGLIPTSLAAPMHPNAAGEQAMAKLILDAV